LHYFKQVDQVDASITEAKRFATTAGREAKAVRSAVGVIHLDDDSCDHI
jgi:hypothetical protein